MDSGVKGFAASNVKRRYMFTAMELLLGVVFLGWLFMWVMMPTKTYKQTWMVKLRADTNSTYIGPLGWISQRLNNVFILVVARSSID